MTPLKTRHRVVRVDNLKRANEEENWLVISTYVFEKFTQLDGVEVASQVRTTIRLARDGANGDVVPDGFLVRIWQARQIRLPRKEDY